MITLCIIVVGNGDYMSKKPLGKPLEDVIEEVFWDIKDETDNEIDPIRTDGNNSYLIQPWVRIEEMLDLFELTFDMIWLDANEWEGEQKICAQSSGFTRA